VKDEPKKVRQRQWFSHCSILWVLGKSGELIDTVSLIWALVVYLMANTTFLDAPERQNLKEQISPYNTVTLTVLSKILQITCTPASSELTNNCHIPLGTTRGEMWCPVDLWGHLSPALHKGHCLLFAFYCPGDRYWWSLRCGVCSGGPHWKWQDLGVSLGLHLGDLDPILSDNPHSSSHCLTESLKLWLRQNYEVWASFIHRPPHFV